MIHTRKAETDEWYTPEYAVMPIIPYIPAGARVWCPFDTKESAYVKVLRDRGFVVEYSHISDGKDFFKTKQDCDIVLSNPPFSKIDDIVIRLFDLGKPFGLLRNMNGLFDSRKKFELYRNRQIELMVLYPRINFKPSKAGTGRSTCPYQSCYLCHQLLPDKIMFSDIHRASPEGAFFTP